MAGSHPAIRFEQIPATPGPLSRLDSIRPSMIEAIVNQTSQTFLDTNLETLLGEALYSERLRLKVDHKNLFTLSRFKRDKALWSKVHSGLLKTGFEVDRKELLQSVVSHYAGEIAGHFDPRVYEVAMRAVPWGFSWLLNAASVQRFLPWGMTESLGSRLHIVGEIPHLQKLAQLGTILLVPTHQSNIDSVLIGYVIYLMSLPPFAYGAGLNLYSNPILNFLMSRLGAYTVDRRKTSSIYKLTLKNYSVKILQEGVHSIFFPGGGRSRSGAIENKLKLGLLGTGLQAQIDGYLAGSQKPKIFVVPMVTSYNFVLEASSLIESYLIEEGKHRFIMTGDESWQFKKVLGFFWRLFSSQSAIVVRIGKPLDVFGNFVDEKGESIGPNGTRIDPIKWLTTNGEVQSQSERDVEYTRQLGSRLVDRYHHENTVLSSHLVAFALFEALRVRYPDFDLFRFLRISLPQRSMSYPDFLVFAEACYSKVALLAERSRLFLSEDLYLKSTEEWVKEGIQQLGLLHDMAVVKEEENVIFTEDMSLLYYYRNRLTGYGLMGRSSLQKKDTKGFLI